MTKFKETIERLESLKWHCKSMQDIDECTNHDADIKAIDTAVEVLGNLPTKGKEDKNE